jgi:hypothetical protein
MKLMKRGSDSNPALPSPLSPKLIIKPFRKLQQATATTWPPLSSHFNPSFTDRIRFNALSRDTSLGVSLEERCQVQKRTLGMEGSNEGRGPCA